MTITAAAGALVLAGCGGEDAIDQLTDAFAETATEQEAPAESDPDEGGANEAGGTDSGEGEADDPSQGATEVATVDGRAIDATVHHAGLEYTVSQMTVVDLDAEASPDGEVEQRVQGLELVFETSVFNPGNDTREPRVPVSLRWEEPDTGNVVDVSGRGEFRQVPGDSSSSGEIVVPLRPEDLEVYDDASARLILGQSGQSAAQLPVGSDAELIDRFPVQQPDVVGKTFDVSDVLVTITAAEVRWDGGSGNQYEDGLALFELTYTMDNQGGRQSCSTRGEGAFALTLPNGDSIVDMRVTDRCVGGGETVTDVRTGFTIDADYAGDYTMRHERGDDQDEISFTLVETDGSPAAERDTR